MPIINQVVKGGGSPTPTTRYGLNDKAWAGDLITDSGYVRMRTDQAVGTLTGLESMTRVVYGTWREKFKDSTGLVGNVNLSGLTSADVLVKTFYGTGITGINLSGVLEISECTSMCENCVNLVSVNLSNCRYVLDMALDRSFAGCSSLTTLSLPSITDVNCWETVDEDPETGDLDYLAGFGRCFSNMCVGCSNLVVHFPASLESSMTDNLPNMDPSDIVLAMHQYLFGTGSTASTCSISFDL